MDKALDVQRHCHAAELDPLARSMDEGEAPQLLTSASPQRPPQQRLSTAASAVSSLTTSPMLLSGSGTGMMTLVKTQFVPLGNSLSDSDSDSEVTGLAVQCSVAGPFLFTYAQVANAMYANGHWSSVYCRLARESAAVLQLDAAAMHICLLGNLLLQSAVDGFAIVSQDIRLEQKYGIIRGCRRKSSLAASHKGNKTHWMKQQQQVFDSRAVQQ